MRPIRLVLENFAGIKSGQGKNRIEINLDKIDSDAKIVALTGPNGAGKTTIMDNLHPFRVMPYKATSPTPGSFSFYDHLVPGADGLKELDFEHDGRLYRSVVRMKAAGKTKKQEAYLFQVIDGQSVPFNDATTGIFSDGKAETYDKSVECILGKPEVFFTAIYSAQGKKPISSMGAGEIKSLLSAMMGMQSLKSLSEKAADVVKGLKPHLSAKQSQTIPLQQIASKAELLQNQLGTISAQITEKSEKMSVADTVIREKVATLSALETLAMQQESLKSQRLALNEQLDSANQDRTVRIAQFDKTQANEKSAIMDRLNDLGASERGATASVNQFAKHHAELTELISSETKLVNKKAELKQLQDELGNARFKIDSLFIDENRLTEITDAVGKIREALATDASDGKNLAATLLAAQQAAALINQVPCSGHAFSGSCSLLASARSANAEIPQKEIQLTNLRKNYTTESTKLKSIQTELTSLQEKKVKLQALKTSESDIAVKIANCKTMLADLPRIDKAKSEIPSATESLNTSKKELVDIQIRIAKGKLVLTDLTTKHTQARTEFISIVDSEIVRVKKALDALPAPVASSDITRARGLIEQAEKTKALIEHDAHLLHEKKQKIAIELQQATDANIAISSVQIETDRISQEIANWTLLSKALGNDGIIAMSIDDAGPSISTICNGLLNDCYGGRFNIRIGTQSATATGILKESFLIHVEDSLRGEQKTLDDMSGGEKVWINECLVRAMALYMAQTSGVQYSTLFSDESDGPLDETRKRQFMMMKRAVLNQGGYQREYIITQTPELWEMCDAVLDVTAL